MIFRYGDFEWDPAKAERNERKHGVTFQEATTVFSDPHAFDAPDLVVPGRFVIIGLSLLGRVLFVVLAERDHERIRIISARKATAAQRRKYEQD